MEIQDNIMDDTMAVCVSALGLIVSVRFNQALNETVLKKPDDVFENL